MDPIITFTQDHSAEEAGCQTVVFHLWKQRNNLIHNQISMPPNIVFQGIDKKLKNIILKETQETFQSSHGFVVEIRLA